MGAGADCGDGAVFGKGYNGEYDDGGVGMRAVRTRGAMERHSALDGACVVDFVAYHRLAFALAFDSSECGGVGLSGRRSVAPRQGWFTISNVVFVVARGEGDGDALVVIGRYGELLLAPGVDELAARGCLGVQQLHDPPVFLQSHVGSAGVAA